MSSGWHSSHLPVLERLDLGAASNLRWTTIAAQPGMSHLMAGRRVVAAMGRRLKHSRLVTADDGWEIAQRGLFPPRLEVTRITDGSFAAQFRYSGIWGESGTVELASGTRAMWERSQLGHWFRSLDGPPLVSFTPDLEVRDAVVDVYPAAVGVDGAALLLALGWELLILQQLRSAS